MPTRQDMKLHLLAENLPNDPETLIEGIRQLADACKETVQSDQLLRALKLTSGEIALLAFISVKQRVTMPSEAVSGHSATTKRALLARLRKKISTDNVAIPRIGKFFDRQSFDYVRMLVARSSIDSGSSEFADILGFNPAEFAVHRLPKDPASLRIMTLKLIHALRGNVREISLPGADSELQKTILTALWAKPTGYVSLSRLIMAIDTPYGEPISRANIYVAISSMNKGLPYKNIIIKGGYGSGYMLEPARRELVRAHLTFKTGEALKLEITPVRNDPPLGSISPSADN